MSFKILLRQTFSNWKKMSLGELSENKSLQSAEDLILYLSTLELPRNFSYLFFSKVLIFIVMYNGVPRKLLSL